MASANGIVFHMTDAEMVAVAVYCYAPQREILSYGVVQEMIKGDQSAPTGGEQRGTACKKGLRALLVSRNLLPVGERSSMVRLAVRYHDIQDCSVNDSSRTWGWAKELCLRYYHPVHDHLEHSNVVHHNIVGHNRQIPTTFDETKNQIVALLVHKVAYGFNMKPSGMGRLWEIGEKSENSVQHWLVVMPLVTFFVTEMNPNGSLDFRKIMRLDCGKLEHNIRTKSSTRGIWSQQEALRRVALPHGDPEAITYKDQDMCRGIKWKFARLFSLIISDFKWPFDKTTSLPHHLWITEHEKSLLYVGINPQVQPKCGRPSYP